MSYNPKNLPHMKDQEFTRQYVQKLNPPVFENKLRRNWVKDLYHTQTIYKRRNPDARDLATELILAAGLAILVITCYYYSAEITAVFEIGEGVKGGR